MFTWSATNMPRIDSEVMVHQLNIDLTHYPMKQKKWSFALEPQQAIIEEANKLVNTRFIRKVMYLDWLASMMLKKKVNKKSYVHKFHWSKQSLS